MPVVPSLFEATTPPWRWEACSRETRGDHASWTNMEAYAIDLLIRRRGDASPEATFSGGISGSEFFLWGTMWCSFRFIHGPYIATVLPRYVFPPGCLLSPWSMGIAAVGSNVAMNASQHLPHSFDTSTGSSQIYIPSVTTYTNFEGQFISVSSLSKFSPAHLLNSWHVSLLHRPLSEQRSFRPSLW